MRPGETPGNPPCLGCAGPLVDGIHVTPALQPILPTFSRPLPLCLLFLWCDGSNELCAWPLPRYGPRPQPGAPWSDCRRLLTSCVSPEGAWGLSGDMVLCAGRIPPCPLAVQQGYIGAQPLCAFFPPFLSRERNGAVGDKTDQISQQKGASGRTLPLAWKQDVVK